MLKSTALRILRVIIWGGKAFVARHFFLLISGLLVAAGVIFLALNLRPALPKRSPRVTVGMVGIFKTPTELPEEITSLVTSGLTQITPTGEATASLARSWEISEDQKTYVFSLAKDRFWHDGKEIKAQDLNFNLGEVEIETVDQEIRFHLKQPLAPFPTFLARPLFKKETFLGNKSFKIVSVQKKGGDLAAVDLFSDELSFRLNFRFYASEKMLLTAAKLGEVQVLDLVKDPMVSLPGFNHYRQPDFSGFIGVFYNTRSSFFAEKANRLALTYALPRENLDGPSAKSPLSPLSWAYNTKVREYKFDLKKAKDLLASPSGKLTLTTTPPYQELAKKIASLWEKLGLEVKIKSVPTIGGELGDFDALLIGQKIPADPDQYSLWHSTQKGNITGFVNPRLDKLLEDGRKTLEKDKRREIYLDFQKLLAEEVPVAFLYYPNRHVFIAKKADTPKLRHLLGIKEE